jgi:protein-disulfide isomerase
LDRYKDKVRFVYRDNPLSEIHPWAVHAAVDANCLAAQSGDIYWAFVDYIHSHGQEVNGENRDEAKSAAALDRIARQQAILARLDAGKSAQLEACIQKQDETQVRTSREEADALGADGAPALFVEGERIIGFVPESQLWAVIDRALRDAGIAPPEAPQPQTAAKQPTP